MDKKSASWLGGLRLSMTLIAGVIVTGCVSGPLTTREQAAGIGALGGAATGAAIGSTVDRPGTGALIGGALGLGAGALIGDQLQAQEQAQRPQPKVGYRPPREEVVVIERERVPDVVVIERERDRPPPWARARGWRRKHELRALADHYYYKMTNRGWTLKEWEIEEDEAELEFRRGEAKAEIKIKEERAGFKVRIKSSHED